jgi:hypothetical protein
MKLIIKFLNGKSQEINEVKQFKSNADFITIINKTGKRENYFHYAIDTFEMTED